MCLLRTAARMRRHAHPVVRHGASGRDTLFVHRDTIICHPASRNLLNRALSLIFCPASSSVIVSGLPDPLCPSVLTRTPKVPDRPTADHVRPFNRLHMHTHPYDEEGIGRPMMSWSVRWPPPLGMGQRTSSRRPAHNDNTGRRRRATQTTAY